MSLEIVDGPGPLQRCRVVHASSDARCEVHLQGAHLTWWSKKSNGIDSNLLFLSQSSYFETAKPIRGGVPICWPQFSDFGSLGQHGFARNRLWSLKSFTVAPESGDVTLALGLQSDESSLAVWAHPFSLTYTITLSVDSIRLALRVENTGDKPFTFTGALHTYFGVQNVEKVSIVGLKNVHYLDSLRQRAEFTEEHEKIEFTGETDRIYLNTPDTLFIDDHAAGLRFSVVKSGFADAVVWNPWIEKSKRMPDFGDLEYPSMVCLESASIRNSTTVEAQQTWEGTTVLQTEAL